MSVKELECLLKYFHTTLNSKKVNWAFSLKTLHNTLHKKMHWINIDKNISTRVVA
jgi:hypothetical protein